MKVVKKVVLLSLMFLVVVFVVGCKQEQVPIENTQKLRYSEEYVESLEDRVAKLETECHYLRLAVNGFDKVDSYYLDDYNEFKEDYQSDNEKLIEELREFYAEYEVLKLEVEQLRIELANMKK
jgi:hypothetical protein